MIGPARPATADTNVVVYAILQDSKAELATAVLGECAFLSVQALNEYANVASRKLNRTWPQIEEDLVEIRGSVPKIIPLDSDAHFQGLRIASRYRLAFYDALMLAVALSGGARTFYSEDMQHDMIIDGALHIVDPFRSGALAA